jgi:hypothetical protein
MAEHQVDQDRSVSALEWFNVGLRGLMELGIIAAFGYWGYQVGSSTPTKVLLGILSPLIVFGFWGLVDFRQAGSLSEALRLLQELIISGLAAAALFVAGQPVLCWLLALISIVQHGLVYLLGDRLLKQP